MNIIHLSNIPGDATPNYIWHFDGWRKVAANRGAKEPKVMLAHLIKELTPMAKIIVMVRDPIKRYKGPQIKA